MRNKLTSIILLVSIVLLIIVMFVGIKIGNFHILSLSQLRDKNDELNTQITTASKLTSIDYPSKIDQLEETYEKYTIEKQKYEELSGFTDDEDKKEIYETKQYDIGYLWKTFGKYATSHNLTIGMEVQKSNNGENLYNLNFNVSGQYVNVSEFITNIENDSDLYFRIYNFKMSGSGETVSSTFTVQDVAIDSSTITTVTTASENSGEQTVTTETQNTIQE